MRLTRMSIVLLLLLCAAFPVAAFAAAQQKAPDAGKSPYPALGLSELQGVVIKSKGKVVVVNVFASWCGPCREEMPGFIAIRKSIPEDKLVMLGVSLDEDMAALQQFVAKTGFNFPVYLGQEDFVRWAGISAIPHTLIYDKTGKLLVSEAGMIEEKDLRAFLTKELGKK